MAETKEDNYYCQQKCGQEDFSIHEWNKSYKEIEAMPISRAAKDKLINGEPCTSQCFDCMAIVGKTRAKNKEFRENLNNQKNL